MSAILVAHCRDSVRLGEEMVQLHLLGRWPDHNVRRLVSADPASPRGEVIGRHPSGNGLVALFDARQVLAYCVRRDVPVEPL